MLISVAEWLPDLPPLSNPGALVATNVIPEQSSYAPFPGLDLVATGPGGVINNVIFARDDANNTYVFCGDQTALYQQVAGSLSVATRLAGGAYNVGLDDCWEFIPWAETVIAVNGLNDTPQQISLGAANFANLSGMPKARHIAVINNFVVIGNISDSDTHVQRVRWSGINNSAAWSVDPATLADFQDLPGPGGWVQKIVGGENGGYVFQERAIFAMAFVGTPFIFQFNKIHDGVGAYAAQSVINYENVTFFLAADGFYQFNGSDLTPIGTAKIDKTFFADLDTNYVQNIRSAIWPDKKIVAWSYPGIGNTGGLCNHILIYSWAFKRWSRIDIPVSIGGSIQAFGLASSIGYTLDGLDAVSSSLDALAFSLDAREWTGGNLSFSAFIGGDLYYFTGTPLDATVDTGESVPGLQAMGFVKGMGTIEEVWPLVEGASLSAINITILARENLHGQPSATNAMSPKSAGFAEAHITSRYFRYRIETHGDFDNIQGVDVVAYNAGKR